MPHPQRQSPRREPGTTHAWDEQQQPQGAPLRVPTRLEDALAKAHEVSTRERPRCPPALQTGRLQTQQGAGHPPVPSDSAGPWSAAQLLWIPTDRRSSPGPSALRQRADPGAAAARLTLLQAAAPCRAPLHAVLCPSVRPSLPSRVVLPGTATTQQPLSLCQLGG